MSRKLLAHLLIGGYLAMQILAVPHAHGAVGGHSGHDHRGTHFHCDWPSGRHHHHGSDHSHASHGHHAHPRTSDEAPPVPSSRPSHDGDAVYVGDAFVTTAVQHDTHDGLPAVGILGGSFAPEYSSAPVATRETAQDHFADLNLYLILRALRI